MEVIGSKFFFLKFRKIITTFLVSAGCLLHLILFSLISQLIKLDVSIEVLSVTSSGAASFRFSGNKHFSEAVLSRNGGVRTEDGGMLHVGTDGNVGLKEIFR